MSDKLTDFAPNSDTAKIDNPFADAKVRSRFFGPTPAGQQWLDEHPEQAQKAEGYVPVTFIPFGEARIQEMIAAKSPPPDDTRRHLETDERRHYDHIRFVTWHWRIALGCSDGYVLYRDTFGPLQVAETGLVKAALPTPITCRADRIAVDWIVTWHHHGGGIVIDRVSPALPFSDGDNDYETQHDKVYYSTLEGEMSKDQVITRVNELHAAAVAARPETEFDTFDQPPALPWGDDNHLRGIFFARYEKEVWSPRACPKDQAEKIRKAVLVREYGTDTLKGFGHDVEELLKKLTAAVESEYPLAMAYFDEQAKTGERKDPPSSPENGQSPETGSTEPVSDNRPIAPEIPRSETGKVETGEKALAVIKPAQIEVVRDTAFTGRALLPTEAEWRTMGELAMTGFKSGLVKGIGNADAAKFIVETGRELGIPPSLALRKIHLIHGQPSMAAELMWAMVLNSGKLEDFEIVEADDRCTVTVQRKGAKKPYTTTFSLDMARKIATKEDGKTIVLADKYNWKAMPGVMCKWRALSAACRTIFPDVTLGLYSREEMEDAIDFTVDPDTLKQAAS